MITNACEARQADIAALKREPFARVLDQVLRWLRAIQPKPKKTK